MINKIVKIFLAVIFIILIVLFTMRWLYVKHFKQGASLFDMGNYEQAISEFNRAGNFSPDDSRISYNIAAACIQLGRFSEAIFFL